MNGSFHETVKRYLIVFFLLLFLFGISCSEAGAVSRFKSDVREKRAPANLKFDEIWFYDQDRSKIIPDIDLDWITVVLRSYEGATRSDIKEQAKSIMGKHRELIDMFYDSNLAEDACFFKLKSGLKETDLTSLISRLNSEKDVDYTQPVLTMRGKTFAFFNVIHLKWKMVVDKEHKESLMKQIHATFDEKESICRVNVFEMPLFKAVNLLAEDINVAEAVPSMVELKPSIQARLTLGIQGGDMGDRIPFLLSITFSDIISVDPSSLANINLKPADIQKELFDLEFDPYDYVKAVSKNPIKITGWMKFYAPGEFEIPPVTIKYTCSTCSGEQVRTVETESQVFRVASIIPSKQAENKLIVPMNTVDPDYNLAGYHKKAVMNLVVSLSAFFLAALCLAWFVATVYRAKKQREGLRERKKEEILAETLRSFLQKETPPPHWVYVKELSTILREYLAEKYRALHDPHGGSGEVFFTVIQQNVPETLATSISTVLKEIDEVIALEMDTYPELEQFKERVRKIIDARRGEPAGENHIFNRIQ